MKIQIPPSDVLTNVTTYKSSYFLCLSGYENICLIVQNIKTFILIYNQSIYSIDGNMSLRIINKALRQKLHSSYTILSDTFLFINKMKHNSFSIHAPSFAKCIHIRRKLVYFHIVVLFSRFF